LRAECGEGAYDQKGVCTAVAERHPGAAVIVPPRSTAVPSKMAETEPTQRDRHLQFIAKHWRMAWQRRALLPNVKHRTSGYLNNRAENSHRPTRRRERQMQKFKSPGQAPGFLSAHAMIYGHFRPRRHRLGAGGCRRARAKAFQIWRQETAMSDINPADIILLSVNCGPSGRFHDGQHRRGAAERAKSAMIGGNMLVVAGPGTEEVAQLVVSSAEPSRRSRALEAVHGSVSALDAAMILLDSVVHVLAGPVPNPLAQLGADRARVAVMAIRRDPVWPDAGHRLR
jgi:DDE domain